MFWSLPCARCSYIKLFSYPNNFLKSIIIIIIIITILEIRKQARPGLVTSSRSHNNQMLEVVSNLSSVTPNALIRVSDKDMMVIMVMVMMIMMKKRMMQQC